MQRVVQVSAAALVGVALCVAVGPGAARAESTQHSDSSNASRSHGLPWQGRLLRGVRLPQSDVVRHLPEARRDGHFYGTQELVGLLQRSARAVADHWPGSRLSVGELSARHGGYIEGHHSHRNGRDADIAFYMRGLQGAMARFWSFVAFGKPGVAISPQGPLRFDDARNWELVSALLRDPYARVQYLFVAKDIRTRLLIEGRRGGASPEQLAAAAAVLIQPKHGHAHANHFHLRIYCSLADRPACVDGRPYWPWYQGTPPGGEYAQLPTVRWRRPVRNLSSTATAVSSVGMAATP